MKKISSRQLIIFYCIYSFSIKFLMLPSLLAKTAGKDAWISALAGTLLELTILFIALTVLTRNQDTDIYSHLRGENPRTKVVRSAMGKVVIFAMLAVFLLQLFILVNQTFHLLNENLFDKVSVRYFSIPLLLLGMFFCFMPARAIFRSGEVFFVFIIIGIALSVFPAITRINASEILPIFNNGVSPSVKAFYMNVIYFESAFFLLMFMGDIKIEKHFRKKLMITATILGLFFVFFVFMFYSLFGPLAPLKNTAVSNLTVYSSYITNNGRLDWVIVTMWLLLLFLRIGVTFYCAFACLRYITHLKHRAGYLSACLAIFVYLLSTFIFATTQDLTRFMGAILWLIAALYVIVPVLLLILGGRKKNA